MSLSSTVSLPAQPAAGRSEYIALGGDGKTAPMGCYFSRIQLVGDAGGGSITLHINLDPRFTNLVAVVNASVDGAAAAPEFSIVLTPDTVSSSRSQMTVCGTAPFVTDATSFTDNAAFLWYPPPIYYQQEGQVAFATANVSASELYKLTIEVYVFDSDVRRLTPLSILQMNVPGVSAPAAI